MHSLTLMFVMVPIFGLRRHSESKSWRMQPCVCNFSLWLLCCTFIPPNVCKIWQMSMCHVVEELVSLYLSRNSWGQRPPPAVFDLVPNIPAEVPQLYKIHPADSFADRRTNGIVGAYRSARLLLLRSHFHFWVFFLSLSSGLYQNGISEC